MIDRPQASDGDLFDASFQRIIAALLLLLALVFTLDYLSVAFDRLHYGFDLDFIENAIFLHAWQFMQGKEVYLPPNASFVPQPYMPLYPWLGGLFLHFSGPAYWPLRLLSFASILLSAVMLYVIALHERTGHVIGIACAALFLAGYQVCGGTYELARVDGLFGALTLAGLITVHYWKHSRAGLIVSGILLGLALMTKQTALLIVGAAGLTMLMTVRARVVYFVLPLALVVGLPSAWLQITSHGWYAHYVVEIAFGDKITASRAVRTVTRDFLGLMGGLIALSAVALGIQIRQCQWQRLAWFVFIAIGSAISVAGRSAVGGNLNNLMLGYLLLCLAPILFAAALRDIAPEWRRRGWFLLALALIVQFGLVWNPASRASIQFRPDREMETQANRLLEYLATAEGESWVMLHPAYSLFAGKTPGVHIQSLYHSRHRGVDPLPADLVGRIESHYYAQIISDQSPYFETEPDVLALLEQHYTPSPFPAEMAPPTLTGIQTRPMVLYTPIATE